MPVLIDNGTHSVDIVRYFLGDIAEVQAIECKRIQGLAVEDTVELFLRSVSGVACTIDLSWSLNKDLEHFINIYGSGGTIRIGWAGSRFTQRSSPGWTDFGQGYQKVPAFVAQLENFRRAIRGEEELRVTPEDALASVDVIEAAYRSLTSSNWVPVRSSPTPS